MSGYYPPEAVEAAANKLMGALALHEDARGTVTDLLADLWDAGRESAGVSDVSGFLVSGGPGGVGHYAINAVDPTHGARPVIRAYGAHLREDYTSFAEAARDQDVLNRMWLADGGAGANIRTIGDDAPTVHSEADAAGWGDQR